MPFRCLPVLLGGKGTSRVGVRRSVWDPETSTGEWGYSTRRHMWRHMAPGDKVPPERGVVLTDLQSSMDVNKPLPLHTLRPSVIYAIVNKLLSLSLSLSLSRSLLCVDETRVTRPNGECGCSTRRKCWATSAQRRCHPQEAFYLPTSSHLFDCQ
jgi:hypothetical protein